MVTKKLQATEQTRPELKVTTEDGKAKIGERIRLGHDMREGVGTAYYGLGTQNVEAEAAFRKWHDYNVDFLGRLFTTEKISNDYRGCGPLEMASHFDTPQDLARRRNERLAAELEFLESLFDRIELLAPEAPVRTSIGGPSVETATSTDVFIVHGHDSAIRESVARVVTTLGLNPIILHEQPNSGRTVLEKFEDNSDVGFAVVLLTADDFGRSKAAEADNKRARQNVVFELGYFFGKLGRARVCALYEHGVELPSDVHGLVYTEIDAGGGWRTALAQELAAAGYDIDFNRLFRRQ